MARSPNQHKKLRDDAAALAARRAMARGDQDVWSQIKASWKRTEEDPDAVEAEVNEAKARGE